ncbi:MAG TPA: hypothetical protein PK170_12010 [Anaerolineae bacterium]|nr:hypothetical protein [Anaerolineae bacterium]
MYVASLPERLPRAFAAGVGGIVYEGAVVLLPEWTRRSQLYQALLGRWLRIAIEWVGGVEGEVLATEPVSAGRLTLRKAAGNAVEFTSIFTIGFSPLWMLAAASDLMDGAQVYLDALTGELVRVGVLTPGQSFASVDGLLETLGGASNVLSKAIDIPPLARQELMVSVLELDASWQALRASASSLPNADRLRVIAQQIQATAERQQIPVWMVSSLLGLGALQAGVKLGQVHVFDYYRQALSEMSDRGLAAYAQQISRPYLQTAAGHLDPSRTSVIEFALRRKFRPAAKGNAAATKQLPPANPSG